MSDALEKAAKAIFLKRFPRAPDTDWEMSRSICLESRGSIHTEYNTSTEFARAAITAFLAEVGPEALARAWKPFAFDEADSYYPYRGQIRKSAIYDASEMLAALRKLMNPDKKDARP